MSQKFKAKRAHQADATVALTDPFTTAARIRELIRSGKQKAALDLAKDSHKAQNSANSEELLIEAYIARIQSMLQQNLVLEAQALIALVEERHPSANGRLQDLALSTLVRTGAVDKLLLPLNDPELAPERRAAIERTIQREISDPGIVAASNVLAEDHPLRKAATELHRALVAVTKGDVADPVIELPNVSHRSPLAPWKLLIRAIAAFYRDEDEACRQALNSIRPESTPARLIPTILAMMEGRTNPSLTPSATHLVSLITGNAAELTRALEALDRSFDEDDENRTLKAIRMVVPEMRRHAPDRFEEFKQRIVVRCMMDGFEADEVAPLLGGPVREDPGFLRLLARGMEQVGHPASIAAACGAWDSFRQLAVEQGWFKANGPEVATLYLHMAEVLARLKPEDLRHIQRLGRSGKKEIGEDQFYVFPERLFERACTLDPHTEAFSQWMRWGAAKSEAEAARVAQAWHKIVPTDIQPIVYLMENAAKRQKYPSALKYLESAERIDAVNPRVRHARLRLMVGNAIRQIQQKAQRPGDQTIAAVAELPQAQQGDRPAFLAALRYLSNAVRGKTEQAAPHRAEVARALGSDLAANLLIAILLPAISRSAVEKLPNPDQLSDDERHSLPRTVARVLALAADVEVKASLPQHWVTAAAKQFPKSAASLQVPELLTLGDWAQRALQNEFAYMISAAGLKRGGPSEAAFLLMRARSLTTQNYGRTVACAVAAAELAREQRNMDIVDQAVPLFQHPFGGEQPTVTLAQAKEVLRRESAATEFPKGKVKSPNYNDILPSAPPCPCPNCRRARGEHVPLNRLDDRIFFDDEFDDEFDEDHFDEDPFVDLKIPPGVPRDLAEMLIDVARKAIAQGQSPEEFFNDMDINFSGGPKKKKGKRK